MRTTVRIDDDLMRELRSRATTENVSLTCLVNRVIRRGLVTKPIRQSTFRQKVFSMGEPRVNIDKALSLVAAQEDAEIIRKLMVGK